jgi:uncharacterized phage-associated protein
MTLARDVARVFEYLSIESEGTPIEKTRLNKLLYFAQGHAFTKLGHEMFSNEIDAWDHGPVVAVVWTGFKKIVDRTEKNGISDVQISPDEMDVIIDVWEQYKHLTAKELVDITHQEGSPWRDIYKPDTKNLHIPKDLIKQYFARPENSLKDGLSDIEKLPTVNALPAEEYDPDEDSMWEALLHGAN